MPNRYNLYGFASGAGRGPHFIEPVYSDGKELYVQVSSQSNDTVLSFAPFDESVDIHEHKTDETSEVGQKCTYGVIDSGDRLIYGDRDYVSRYLSQNIRSYLGTPYFLKECQEFTGGSIPELEFVKSKRDLLELSVAVNSIKEFTRSNSNIRQWLIDTHSDYHAIDDGERQSEASFGKSETLFGAWLSHAENRGEKIAKSERWSSLEKDFLGIYDNDAGLANSFFSQHFTSCKYILTDHYKSKSLSRDDIVNLRLRNPPTEKIQSEPANKEYRLVTNKDRVFPANHKSTEKTSKWILNALRSRKLSFSKISVQVYFISIALEVTFSMEDNDDGD